MDLKATHSIKDNLDAAHADKTVVEVHLRGGQSLAGSVGEVGDHYVLIAELTGREFYDALVRIDDISAMEVRARS